MFDYRTGRFVKLRLRNEGYECLNQPPSGKDGDGPIDVHDLLRASLTPGERFLRERQTRPSRFRRLRLYCLRLLIGLAVLAAAIHFIPQTRIVVVSEISGALAYLLGLTYGMWARPQAE